MSGSMKLCPLTVSVSPRNGDVGNALTATGIKDMKIEPEFTGTDRPVSDDVCTVMPVGEPVVAAPKVTPPITTMCCDAAEKDAAFSWNTTDEFEVE